ncbi:hypothetical protein GCM10010178_63770 [Lentzea flava]|uniref:Uncharacterized protein n=1 Tax=Lentzea flava TaxID=103732 RepID=A0ABQ2V0D6_9PSEU|nr:hypothetical protein GCM10010178_63770 [Lentzea flava]
MAPRHPRGRLTQAHTTLAAAHRPTTTAKAHRPTALTSGGRIIEQGTHAHLLAANGPHAHLLAANGAHARLSRHGTSEAA